MKTPLLPPAALMGLLALTQPVLAKDKLENATGVHERGRYREAFKSYAVLARNDDLAAQFKLAALYYLAGDDVREALWSLISGEDLPHAA